MVGSLETCSAGVYQSSRKFSKAIFAQVSRSAQGRFTGDGGRLRGVFQQKFKLDYGNLAVDCALSGISAVSIA